MKLDSIIFDLDGTLWDATRSLVQPWNEVLERHHEVKKKLTIEDIQGVMGLVVDDIAKKFFPDLDGARGIEIVKECCKHECRHLEEHGGILYEKLEETLKELSMNHKLFIVSNCECGYIEAFYAAHKLEKYFSDFENPGRTGLTKGENIKLIIERNNLKNPIYVGDTPGDQKAARFAGIPFVYARYGFGKVEEYDYVIDNFDELLEVVK